MIQMNNITGLHSIRRKPIIRDNMKRILIAAVCLPICSMFADTNTVLPCGINDVLDIVNLDMKQKYNLNIKTDRSLLLTGYTVQDPISKLFKTYSVLHFAF